MLGEGILPFRQFVLKVHSRCDLACDHCYVYEHADQSWRGRPRSIAAETVLLAGERIAEHAREHRLPEVRVVLHGGEPLLVGATGLAGIVRTLRTVIERQCLLDLRIHTNGVRLDQQLCELFLDERVLVGVSLDGDRAANDLHRRYADGRSSYHEALRAIGLLRTARYRAIYAGLLCTVDVRSDPVAVYRALAALDPPDIDFLLPHATWDTPPPAGISRGDRTPYADWLGAVYEAWTADGRPVRVRLFDSIIATTRGGASRTEALGLAASDLVVIETDGSIEQADSIKIAFDGAPATGLHVTTHPLDEAAAHPAIKARQQGLAGLSQICRQCSVVTSCGGGLYAHRYRGGQGFDNPSVYCADLKQIIGRVRSGLRPEQVTTTRTGPVHELSAGQFDALAAGYGDPAAMTQLVRAQRSLQRVLIQHLRERAGPAAHGMFSVGWELAVQVERGHATALNEVLAHPYVRAWAERCLRAVTAQGNADGARGDSGGERGGTLPPDVSHLAAIAAAAAIRAGLRAEIDVPVTGEYLHLPTLGRLRVGPGAAAAVATESGGFSVRAGTGTWHVELDGPETGPAWEPVRELSSGRFTVKLEDTDPFRDCHQWAVTRRLTAQDVASWQDQFAEAWPLIERDFPRYLPGLTLGLTAITPLANDVPGREISAAARQAFGAVGTALPADGAVLALLLLHEFQHVKLGGVLDLFRLADPAHPHLYYAPWRKDPRPFEALLQGTYAHLAVTEFWRTRRHRLAGSNALAAAERFARWRMLTAEAIETLSASGALTLLGERFVTGMRTTIEPWLSEPVPASAGAAARRWAAARRAGWERRLRESATGSGRTDAR